MRVLFISDLETRGGAAIAASRLAAGLAETGVEVVRLFAVRASDAYYEAAPWKSVYAGLPRALEVAINGARRGLPGLAKLASRRLAASTLLRAVAREQFDVLHIHAIHNSPWNHDTLSKLSAELPTVWTFHDHWSFSPESYLFRDARGVEQRLKPDGADRAAAQRARIRYFRSRKKLKLVANSRDTARRASELLELPVETITYGLPLDIYRPIQKELARRALRIPDQEFLIGFSSDSNADPVKGFDVLERALLQSGLRARGIAMGGAQPRSFQAGEVSLRALGRVDNPLFQSLVYAACDLLVVPSRAEALGQVAMESIACGTPVVASNVGGLPDIVVPGRSGFLFEAGDAPALAELLRRLEQNRAELGSVAAQCRALAESSWSLRRQADDYLRIYRP